MERYTTEFWDFYWPIFSTCQLLDMLDISSAPWKCSIINATRATQSPPKFVWCQGACWSCWFLQELCQCVVSVSNYHNVWNHGNPRFLHFIDSWPIYLPSLKLTVRTWKWMVGIRPFPFGMAYFQVRTVSFRYDNSIQYNPLWKTPIHQLKTTSPSFLWLMTHIFGA